MPLEDYRKKRDFRRTGEPPGEGAPPAGGLAFAVQKHHARRLHYDFRLEMEGVLKSWAVPKGPSVDPREKRLAVHVEDHPLEYGSFEGTIPEGQYGAGRVILWDRGRWEPEGDPVKSYALGSLKFRLHGVKLRGRWALVRMKGPSGGARQENWLLIKEKDEEARPKESWDILEEGPESVAASQESDPQAAPLPKRIRLQLATPAVEVPESDNWYHEIKLDGYRLVLRIDHGQAKLYSRNWLDWSDRVPSLLGAARSIPLRQALLDGELVKLDSKGVSRFEGLQEALSEGRERELVYFAFDLLHLDGRDLRGLPLSERKRLLLDLLRSKDSLRIQFCDHVQGHGQRFFEEVSRLGLEGVISKRHDRPYRAGRSREWLKVKCALRQEFVIGGFSEPSGSRAGLGALLVGYHNREGQLRYAGRVGIGLSGKLLKELRQNLEQRELEASPFAGYPPRGSPRGVRWTRPEFVAEVKFTSWTADGLLRHPVFLGLRLDKSGAREVVDEGAPGSGKPSPPGKPPANSARARPASGGLTIAGVRLTHPERVLYPREGITKKKLASFYESIAEWILPHLSDRPLNLLRCPDGCDKPCFFQKHAYDTIPPAVQRIELEEKGRRVTYLTVDSTAGLVSLVQMGVLEFHIWGARRGRIDCPDRLVFDLDPDPALPWELTVEAALFLRQWLRKLGLESYLKTTGGKGLHVLVPLSGKEVWEEVKAFTRKVAEEASRSVPELFVATQSLEKRKGRIYIDYLRNSRGATSIAAYSTRAREGAPVSVPLGWDELSGRIRSDTYRVSNLRRRLASLSKEPWEGFHSIRQSITRGGI